MVKVAFVTNFVTPYRVSFYEKLARRQGLDLLVVHSVPRRETGRPGAINLASAAFDQSVVNSLEANMGPFTVRHQLDVLSRLDRYGPDVVVVLGIPGTLSNWRIRRWARRHAKKLLIWASGWEKQDEDSIALMIKRPIARRFYSVADHILVYSTKGKSCLESLGIAPERITVCYNGIELGPLIENEESIERAGKEMRQREGVVDRTLFLYVGGMLKEKRVDLLLRAFASLPSEDNVLWLVGYGPDHEDLVRLAESLRLTNVRFWGRIVERVDAYFSAADFFVLPGVGGLALNQALFWRTPCIVALADGTEDDLVLDGVSGLRFRDSDERSLREAMSSASSLPRDQVQRMQSAGRDLVMRRSNVDAMVVSFENTIQRLMMSR